MGCDIHSRCEVKWSNGWEAIDEAIWKYPYFDDSKPVTYWNVGYINQPFQARNYRLFGALADVRNYTDIEPLFYPRGVPEDASPEWKAEVEKWGPDFHSHSWLTPAELAAICTITAPLMTKPGEPDWISDDIESALAPVRELYEGKNKFPVRFVFAFDN